MPTDPFFRLGRRDGPDGSEDARTIHACLSVDVVDSGEKYGPRLSVLNRLNGNEVAFGEPNPLDGHPPGGYDGWPKSGSGREDPGVSDLMLVRWGHKPRKFLHQGDGMKDDFLLPGRHGAA